MKRYRIIRIDPNAWYPDGTPVVEREHTVTHRSLKAAIREHNRLIDYDKKTGMWSAAWHGSIISEVYPDGTYRFGLDDEDRETLLTIEYEGEYR